MYKYLLCWRYLRTRYIALASIVSVMLGVATMIVVNAVMAGFSAKMRDRLHGVLADVVVESRNMDGFYNINEVMARVKEVGGDRVVAMAPTMEAVGILKIELPNGQSITRPVQLIGIRPEERAKTGDFAEFLFRNRLPGEPEPAPDPNAKPGDVPSNLVPIAPSFEVSEEIRLLGSATGREVLKGKEKADDDEFGAFEDDPLLQEFKKDALERAPDQGAIIGYALATIHDRGMDHFIAPVGSKIVVNFMRGGRNPEPGAGSFTVNGFFKSGMSEYDSSHVYLPLERFQELRFLMDVGGNGAVNQIQIKVADGVDIDKLSAELQASLNKLSPALFIVSTWEQKQGPLLAAVSLEQGILNILLFLIIAVAGFGILAIFFMIVVEKTRDIGILKALGASTSGVRRIFLGYGLSLGIVGSGIGMAGGLAFVAYINEIEQKLSQITGRKVFDDQIYYFDRIPTLIEWPTVAAIVFGALLIAVAASVWPAQRAAKLHPVRALRFE